MTDINKKEKAVILSKAKDPSCFSSAPPFRVNEDDLENVRATRYNASSLANDFKGGFVYILSGKSGVLYVGVTNNLYIRALQHRQERIEGFTKKYKVTRLVYCERFGDIREAISREKQIKGWLRRKKIALIESTNPTWRDLFDDFCTPPNIQGVFKI